MTIEIRQMRPEEISRIGEIDRSELHKARYVAEPMPDGLGLHLRQVDNDPPVQSGPWSKQGVAHRIGLWRPELEKGGVLLGAFDGEKFVGFAVLGARRSDDSAELCALFVDVAWRRCGIGSRLLAEVERYARERRLKAIVIFSNPTGSAVEFYLKHGCKLISLVNKTSVQSLSWDVVFAKAL